MEHLQGKRARRNDLHLFIPWRERQHPLNWQQEFKRDGELKLEIGFGNGEYLVSSAAQDPESNYLGIEMTWGSIKRASGFCRRQDVDNVRLIWEDARAALAWCFEDKSLSSITALYPCPWPKKRHAKFRLFQPSFVSLCNSKLSDGGSLVVVTDSAVYRDEILEQNTLENTGMCSHLEIIPASFSTKYEKKWQGEGQSEFFRLTFTKQTHKESKRPETITVKHHVVPNLDPKTFLPKDEKEHFSVQFKQFIFDQVQNIGLLEVYTHEDTIEQHFYIRIKKQENGWKIHSAGGPPLLPVKSVQRALDIVKETAEALFS